jgi:site-specific DNA recombinase
MKDNLRYAIYCRKSTESEDRQVQSIDDQLHVLKEIAERQGLKVVKTFKESKSAKNPNQRPEFAELIKMINKGQINGILCWKINRLSRNPAESGILQQLLQDEKIKRIHTNSQIYNPQDNAIVFSVEASLGNQFIQDLRRDVKRGMAAKARNGGILGLAPEGYLNVHEYGEKLVKKDPVRFDTLRRAFDLFLTEQYTVPQIQHILNDDWGYIVRPRTKPKSKSKRKYGGGPMHLSSLYRMFRNPRYAGLVPDPYELGVLHKANFPAMITAEEYDKVQDLLGKRGCTRLAAKHKFALRGFMRCGECGCMITAEEKKKKLANGQTNYHTYYHCTRRSKKTVCSQRKCIREEDLYNQLNDLLNEYELTPEVYDWGLKALKLVAKEEIALRDDTQAVQYDSVAHIQKKLDNLLDLVEDGTITSEMYKQRSTKWTVELKERQVEQRKTANRVQNWYEIVGHTLETLTDAQEKFATGELNDKTEILMAIGQNVQLLDGTLMITPNEWMIPIRIGVKSLQTELAKARTMPDKIQKASEEAILNSWCGWGESNSRFQFGKLT